MTALKAILQHYRKGKKTKNLTKSRAIIFFKEKEGLFREILHRQSVGPSQRLRAAPRYGLGSFYPGGKFHGPVSEIITAILGKEYGDSHELGPSHFLTLMVSLGTVTVPVGVSLCLLMCYSEHVLRLKV